jgi:hypothetical protein
MDEVRTRLVIAWWFECANLYQKYSIFSGWGLLRWPGDNRFIPLFCSGASFSGFEAYKERGFYSPQQQFVYLIVIIEGLL